MNLEQEKRQVAQAQKDPRAFAEIYDKYYPKIFGYLLKRTADVQAAQDLTSETFFKALHKLWQFRWRNIPFSAWLYKIATNELRQYYRKGKNISLDRMMTAGFEPISEENPVSEISAAQENLQRHQDFLLCLENIKRLDLKYQEVLSLRFFENKPIKEIAQILGKSEGTVKSLLHRGLKNLRSLMQPEVESSIIDDEGSNELILQNIENYE